jgi:hypothetical protein
MTGRKRRRPVRSGGAIVATLCVLVSAFGPGVGAAAAAGPPIVGDTWASAVQATTARLSAEINPNGFPTGYHFDYIAEAAYQANVAGGKDPFTGASRVPPSANASIGSGTTTLVVLQFLSVLPPNSTYRYRAVATNSDPASPTIGQVRSFTTQATGGGSVLADGRGWEMVSPVDKNGGQVAGAGDLFGGGVAQAAAVGGAVTYGSSASFGAGAEGAPAASQYLATRGSDGWATQNVTAPLFSATYHDSEGGVPYRLFSPDLARGLLFGGDHCRGEDSDCAVANPPLPGSDAPAGYQNYYLREAGAYAALLGAAALAHTAVGPERFDVSLAGASADLKHAVLSTCAALSSNATEAPEGEGCDPAEQNLYRWSTGQGFSLLNLKPGDLAGTPGAELAAQAGAVSMDGSRVYFDLDGDLYLREGAQTKQVDQDASGGSSFEEASADGSVAFFSKEGHLWRYLAATDAAADLTPSGGVAGVLGASATGDYVYYQDAVGLKRWHGGATSTVAGGPQAADESNWPPATGAARVAPDGSRLLFVSLESEALSGYDNTDLKSGEPDSQVYLYDATGPGSLTCVSCNPTNGRPIGPSSVPGAIANGTAPGSTQIYKPRVLSANGRRVFFDSADAIALTDTNQRPDAYQWEAQGEGNCTRPGGCVALVSSGRDSGGAAFVDASADGSDAYFLTDESLVKADPGSADLYDARIGGGFPEPQPPISCEGDACQPLPSEPVDPTLTTLLAGPGNPPVRYPKQRKRCRKGFVKRKGKCLRRKAGAKERAGRRSGGRGR